MQQALKTEGSPEGRLIVPAAMVRLAPGRLLDAKSRQRYPFMMPNSKQAKSGLI